MFWRFDMRQPSHIDSLLEKEDVTLAEILEEDDVLQECKAQNRKLIDFLSKTEVVEEMVDLITKEPSTDVEESVQYKHPNMACELLTADISAITDKLADTESVFSKLWNFLENKPPLNPLLASFFSKTIGSLLARRPELVIDYIKNQEDCLGVFFKHLETSAVMDLILRLITCIDSQEIRMPFLEWLSDQKFIQRLVDLIDSQNAEDIHSNAAQTLCDIVRLTREHMSQLQECAENDPLLITIEMQDTVIELLEHMFHGKKSESALINGISVLLSLLEFKKQSDTLLFPNSDGPDQMTPLDAERLARGVSGTLKAVVPRLADLHQLLTDPPNTEPMLTTVGKLDPPFGNVRLQVCKLISALLVTNTPAINSELAKLGTLNTIWDLFFKYLWNNFLHLEVEKSIGTILANSPTESEEGKQQHPLLVHLFTECKLVQRILDTWDENDSIQQQGGSRRGYMGHLTRIANCLSGEIEKGCNSDQIKSLLEEYVPEEYRDRWTNFVSGSLAEINKKNMVDSVGTHAFHSSSDDEDPDFRDIDFGKDTALQQAFSDYQMQQMTSHFIDQFGFSEEEFAEQEENVNNPFDRISDINFSISANEDNPNSALFEACCNERINSFHGSDDEDMWEEKELTYAVEANARTSEESSKSTRQSYDNNSSDSDEGADEEEYSRIKSTIASTSNASEENKMDVDSGENWVAHFDEIPIESGVAMDTSPSNWGLPPAIIVAANSENTGWANFEEFNAGVNSPESTNKPRSSSPVEMDSEPSQNREAESSTTSTFVPVKESTPPAPLPNPEGVSSSSDASGFPASPRANSQDGDNTVEKEASPSQTTNQPVSVETFSSSSSLRILSPPHIVGDVNIPPDIIVPLPDTTQFRDSSSAGSQSPRNSETNSSEANVSSNSSTASKAVKLYEVKIENGESENADMKVQSSSDVQQGSSVESASPMVDADNEDVSSSSSVSDVPPSSREGESKESNPVTNTDVIKSSQAADSPSNSPNGPTDGTEIDHPSFDPSEASPSAQNGPV